jgi:hypothetical protein
VQIVTAVLVAYAGLVLLGAVVAFIRKVPRPPTLDQMAWILEGALLIRAMLAVAALVNGDQPAQLSTHIGYVISSIVILPVALAAVADDRDRWTSAVIAVAVAAIIVIAIRLQVTAAHG